MNRICDECGASYDDARFTTICPHGEFISEFDAEMKDLAVKLLGKPLRFHHQWKTGPDYRIQSVGATGMVTLDKLAGEFAPYLFVAAG